MVVLSGPDRPLNKRSLATDNLDENGPNMSEEPFLCGVVEGFYGRPWTTEQRKKLFQRMSCAGLNTYLYAPKDDSKHRVFWRELYSVEEADHLTTLIELAEASNIRFIYALSPGLDMTYSSPKELAFLKKKLEQVSSFGCKAFSLLFDDIEVDMSDADKQVFTSFAQAQVSVTNDVYQHLGQPSTFLFCPTEYCSTRAVPSVENSEYLNTIGSKLLPGIDIMWTGPRVISKDITIQHIEELTRTLRRAPVIWDNIHANDYDSKRVFLGPYDGRSPELIPHLRGVMTNPNCEFEANYIALHTLGQWSKASCSSERKLSEDSVVSSDIRLETEGETDEISSEALCTTNSYSPRHALRNAISDWIVEFAEQQEAPSKFVLPTSAVGNPDALATAKPVEEVPSVIPPPENLNELNSVEFNMSYVQPTTLATVNSMVSMSSASDTDLDSLKDDLEPMDCAVTPSSSPPHAGVCGSPLHSALTMEDSMVSGSSCSTLSDIVDINECRAMSPEDVELFVDLFYLPFEHGNKGVEILENFLWLRNNCHSVTNSLGHEPTDDDLSLASEWQDKAEDIKLRLSAVFSMMDRFCAIPNKALLFDFFPYLWDMRAMLTIVDSFVQWLALGQVPYISVCYMQGYPYTWCNKSYQEAFSSGQNEPWMFRGGLQAEFQRLLPLGNAVDLVQQQVPPVPSACMLRVRPYNIQDQAGVYEVCRRTCDDGMDGTEIFPSHPDLIGDKLVGCFMRHSPEYCFVIEDDMGICGYVLGALDAKLFIKNMEEDWIPTLQTKYLKPDGIEHLTPAEEIIQNIYNYKAYQPESLQRQYPSIMRIDFLPDRCTDVTAIRRALCVAIASFKTNGSHGIYTDVHIGDRNTIDAYTNLGFVDVALDDRPDDLVLLGRAV